MLDRLFHLQAAGTTVRREVVGGLGFATLGVPSLDSLADVSTCLERRHTCRVEQMIETEMPRVEELLDGAP